MARRAAVLIVGCIVVVRMARIATLGAVADTLVAFLVLFIFFVFPGLARRDSRQCVTTDDTGAGQSHGNVRQGPTGQGSTGHGDGADGGVTRQDISLECRRRHGRRTTRRPVHIAWLPTTGHDNGEVCASERAIDEEDPHPVRGTGKGQQAGLGNRVDTVDAGGKITTR